EQARAGTHNVVGPMPPLSLRDFLDGSRVAINSSANLVWIDADRLRNEHGVNSFSDMPLWAPLDEDAGFYQVDGSKALAAGISYRPLAHTARDAWRWYQSHHFRDTSFPVGGLGLSAEREREILQKAP
ncbi:MAG: epimerase, partial [Gammaproteobacteria bacterium]|nr:epimerase [Gammaproteobacteria bacterium]